MKKIIYILTLFSILNCAKEEAVPIIADFTTDIFNEDFSVPVQVVILNATKGADDYQWEFPGAVPSSSTQRNPGVIIYETPGTYTITVRATNSDGSEDQKTLDIQIDAAVTIGFEAIPTIDTFAPAAYQITNTSIAANSFTWTFEGGTPATSTQESPEPVSFTEPGIHTIRLEISNGRETYDLEKTITVAPNLITGFTNTVAFDDDDFEVPVRMQFTNTSISATAYDWTFEGAIPANSIAIHPEITFMTPGTHTVLLTATNGKETKTFSAEITVKENTNLRTYTDIKLGINTTHLSNTIGSLYNIVDRKVYAPNALTPEIEAEIDLVFFGLNPSFDRNRFVSPDRVGAETTFPALTNAKKTIVINSQELCGCSASLNTTQFDMMSNDALLAPLSITETSGGLQEFDNSISPRIVLFQTQEGKKGAIKIKDFVTDGQNSYILVDIKMQKEAR